MTRSASSRPKPTRSRAGAPESVLFVLPVRGGSGGANSVIQEAMGMRRMGVDARVATHVRYRDAFAHFYSKPFESGDHFVFFDADDELFELAAPFHVIVATLWSTPRLLAPVSLRWPDKLYAYYIQDYEPWFFPHDAESRQIASDSYTLIPDMVLMAKTDWICRTVRERHDRHVYRIAPSLDHDVYFPAAKEDRQGAPVRIAAMIRPTTPRRAPLNTLRVLQQVAADLDDEVQMLLFGCEPRNLHTFLSRNAPDIELAANFENRGVLTRDGVADLLREADIFIDLSDYQAFGRTGLEAMACGCAVVLPAVGGIYEYAVNGHNCLVTDTRSVDEMTESVLKLARESGTRAEIARNALVTASHFDIRRASLSELSVFRHAWAARHARRTVRAREYRRGPGSMDVAAGAPRVSVLLPPPGDRATADTLEQRVLAPLRWKGLQDKVAVREIRSLDELQGDPGEVCIVYCGVVSALPEAKEIVDQCRKLGVSLVYGTDVAPSADGSSLGGVQSRLIEAADRIVVPSTEIQQDPTLADKDVRVVAASFDDELWLEAAGSRFRRDETDGQIRLLVYGESNVDHLLADIWNRVEGASNRAVSIDVVAGSQLGLDGVNQVRRGELAFAEFIRSVVARGPWDIGLLLADDRTTAADQRFLGFAALGLAIVCSNEGPHLPFAHHQANAIVVKNTVDAWTQPVMELIGAESVRHQLGQRAREDAEAQHALSRWALASLEALDLNLS
ncbi:MAG: glycosyltransferase [Candidatus Tectomicrobia bacterium]|nr:glycosyltransferase [Candidatus Tectomicrobia bacterium]